MRLDGNPLIPELPALSPDLEWMLQSSQASPAMLVEALVREYYAPIYRMALSILDDERAAHQAAQRAIGEALANIHMYREGMGVQNWLYCVALINIRKISDRLSFNRRLKATLPLPKRPTDFGTSAPSCRMDATLWLTVDSLEDCTRLPLLLEIVHGWKTQDIALLLDVGERGVRAQLEAARVILTEELGREGFPVDELEEKKLDALLRRSLSRRWPSISLSAERQSSLVAEILKNSGKWGTRGRLLSSLKDFLLIGLVVVIMGGLAWAWNRWSPKSVASVQIQITPAPYSNEQGLESTPSARIYRRTYIVKPGDTLPSISAQTGTSVEDLKRLNYIGNDGTLEPGRVLEISFWLPFTPDANPTPVTPSAPVTRPFTGKVTSQEIYQYLVSSPSNWHTLWADLQQIDYGPEGYIGPPQAWRVQVWISQPDQIFELYGPLDGPVEYESLNSGGLSYVAHKGGDEISVTDGLSMRMFFGNDNLFFPSLASWLEGGAFRVIGSGQVAGRAALVVDVIGRDGKREERLWIDTRTGMLLRLKKFGEHDDQIVISDFKITAISFDVNFSPATFDPARAFAPGFVQDYRGDPGDGGPQSASAWFFPDSRQRLERLAPPPGFDPSHSRLTFQYLPNPPDNIHIDGGQHAVELFAGGYYLGSLQMACPWSCPCARSPDGSRIAYISNSSSGDIHWIDLLHPERIQGPSENLSVSELAFAPDNQTLGIYGVGFKPGRWIPGIFTLDTTSGEYELLIEIEYAHSLVWSPDGKYLALIGAQQNLDFKEAMIIRLDSSQIDYRTPVDTQDFQSVSDPNWPARDWGVEFPSTSQNLGSCSFPSE